MNGGGAPEKRIGRGGGGADSSAVHGSDETRGMVEMTKDEGSGTKESQERGVDRGGRRSSAGKGTIDGMDLGYGNLHPASYQRGELKGSILGKHGPTRNEGGGSSDPLGVDEAHRTQTVVDHHGCDPMI